MIQIDIILILLELVFCSVLYFIAGYAEKNVSNLWRIIYAVPAIICTICTALSGFEISMLGAYIGSVVLLAGFIKSGKLIRRISCIVSAVSVFITFAAASNYSGYRAVNYTKDFKTAFQKMERYYVLAEHKGINWEALYEKYLPKFEEVNRTHDKIGNIITWLEFSSEFRDGHVCFTPDGNYESLFEEASNRVLGNDYGLALMPLSDGGICAVNVDSSLAETGIHNGTIITSWDGNNPAEIGEGLTQYSPMVFADKDNEAFYRPLYAAGTGKEEVAVTYLDDSGNEKTAVLPKIGTYYSRRMKPALEIIDGGIDTGHLMWVDINENTAALRIKMMLYDSNSMHSGDHSRMKNAIVEKIEELQSRGVTNLILDMRGNGGGSADMVKAIAGIFAPEGEHYYCTDGLWDDKTASYMKDPETGRFVEGTKNYYTGEGLWKGEIVMLVNSNSISAADHTVAVLDDFENITVMGFTEPNGSVQGIGAVELGSGMFSFSSSLLLDENGDVSVDSNQEYESGNDTEIIIPFDKEAVNALFNEGKDYLLEKALEYFEQKN